MSSSISSSDQIAWRAFTVMAVVVSVGLLATILAVAFAMDPYDTGRSVLFEKAGVRPQGPRTAAASRGRDPAFNAAIIGNSHIQLLSPERLKVKTGLDFVQLAVPGTKPKEQLVLIEWYLRHRREPAHALVIGMDREWCTGDPALPISHPFPFWLFSANLFEYVGGLLRYETLEELRHRMRYVFGQTERARPDGYWDYDNNNYEADPNWLKKLPGSRPSGRMHRGLFPAAERLREVAAVLPRDTVLIVIFPPSYIGIQPLPKSPGAVSDQACKDALRNAVAAQARSVVLDWRVDRPENRDPNLFLDATHYRQPIARTIEDDIAAALHRLR